MLYEEFLNIIDEKQEVFCGISDFLWDNPETAFGEYKAVEMLTTLLEQNGFTITHF